MKQDPKDHPPPGRDPRHKGSPQRVEPRRKRKRSSGERAARAARLVAKMERAQVERRQPWSEGGQSEWAAQRQEEKLASLHHDKRVMRRDIYADSPQLEGQPVLKGAPGGGRHGA